MTRRVRGGALALTSAVLAVTGCGAATLDEAALEDEIATELERRSAERPAVDCPGDREATADTTFVCTLTLSDDSRSAVRVTLLDDEGTFRFDLLPPGRVPAPEGEES